MSKARDRDVLSRAQERLPGGGPATRHVAAPRACCWPWSWWWPSACAAGAVGPHLPGPGCQTVLRGGKMDGSFLGRTGDGKPRVKIRWLGLRPVMDFGAGLRYAAEIYALRVV
ncbi:IS4 family transposase [Thiococcus pfennigii]|uniref:IS4 family transposase n=1 Tax=Thiococcus pfennigii TaxID=1057 RepID=UPI0023EE537F|nr:IS4 family transposase [Thiococcus pfennigii]